MIKCIENLILKGQKMFGKKDSIADKINLDEIQFERRYNRREDKAIVRLAPMTGRLFFNPKMVKLLNIDGWENVIAGFHPTQKIIALKLVEDAEEIGTVAIRPPYPSVSKDGKEKRSEERRAKCREVNIKHLKSKMNSVWDNNLWRAERSGVMILLEPLDSDI